MKNLSSSIVLGGMTLAALWFVGQPATTRTLPAAQPVGVVQADEVVDPFQPGAIPAGSITKEQEAQLARDAMNDPAMAGLTAQQKGLAIQPAAGSTPSVPEGAWKATGLCGSYETRYVDAAMIQMAFDPNVVGGIPSDGDKFPVSGDMKAVEAAAKIGAGKVVLGMYTVTVIPDGKGGGEIQVDGPEGADALKRDILCCTDEITDECRRTAGVWTWTSMGWRYVDTPLPPVPPTEDAG